MDEETDISYIEDEICRIHHDLKEKKSFSERIKQARLSQENDEFDEISTDLDEHFIEFYKILQQCHFLVEANKASKNALLETQSQESSLEEGCRKANERLNCAEEQLSVERGIVL